MGKHKHKVGSVSTSSSTASNLTTDLNALRQLQPIKSLLLGDRSKGVILLQGGVVQKTYDKNSPVQVSRFDKEVLILRRLQGASFIPKLLQVDPINKVIYMEYVGKNVKLSRAQKIEVNKALRHLGERYHVFRVKDGKAKYSYRDLFPANICVTDAGKVYLIDFGSALWQIHSKSYAKWLKH